MKINNLAKKIAAAFALLTTVLVANAGDIYSIDLVSQYGGTIPTASKPLVAGEKAVVRVRLINLGYDTVGKPWSLKLADSSWSSFGATNLLSSIYAPAFAFDFGGGSVAYAQYLDTVPVASPANTYTDIFFEYKVQPGDLAMPAFFKVKPGSSNSEYYLRNSDIWRFANEDNTTAVFSFAPPAQVDGPMGVINIKDLPNGEVTRMGDVTGGETFGLYVKSVDFDANFVDAKNKIWRKVGLDDTETSNGVQPTIAVTGGDLESAVTMYVWVDDDNVAVPDPDKAESYKQTVGSMTVTRQILDVTIDAGKSSQTFKLYGKGLGGTANVCMSSSKDFLLQKGSSTAIITNWVTRAISVVALDPSVTLTFKDTSGTATTDLRCSTDYTQPIGTLDVRLSTSPTNNVVVAINPTPLAIYDGLKLTESSNVLEQPWETPVSNVTFDASTSDLTKTLFVYALGSTTNFENTATKFTPAVTGSDQYTKTNTCSVTLRRATPTVVSSKISIADAVLGEDYNLEVTVGGSYDDLNGTNKDKWIFHYKVKSGTKYGSEHVTTNTVSVTGSEVTGKFTTKIDKDTLKLSATALDMWVTSPSGVNSDTVTIQLTVQPGLEAWARFGAVDGSPLGTYGEGDTSADIFFSISDDETKTVWAFLKPEDDSITNKMECSAFTTLGASSKGIAIEKGSTSSLLSAKITMLDGDASGNFTVVICSTNVYDNTKELKYVGDSVLTVVATNVVPRVTKAKQGTFSATNGGTLSGSVPLHIDREFKVDVYEPGKRSDLKAAGTNAFLTEWRFDDDSNCSDTTYSNNGEGWYTIYGDPATTNIHHTFHTPGAHTITVRCKDKDMGTSVYGEEFTFTVVVEDEPVVVIAPISGGTTYYEDQAGPDESMFSVSLVGAPYITSNEVLKVKIEVEKLGTSAYTTNDVVLSTNMVTFASGKTGSGAGNDALRTFYFKELNGTSGSLSEGFQLKATVMNASADADGKTWGMGTYNVYIRNRAPEILSPSAEDQVDSDGSPIINDTNIGKVIEIPWTVSDVAADRTNLTVTCTSSEGKVITTNTVAGVAGTFGMSFDESGEKKTIKITVTDPDLGSSTVTLYYRIAASKVLKLAATGPSDGDSSIALSSAYARAAGAGEGRVFVESASGTVSIGRAVDFKLYWNCGMKTSVDAYGYGYECGDADNGNLSGYGDVALTVDGGKASPTETSFYTYTGDDLRGSYFYGWLRQSDPGAIGTTYTLNPAFELRGSKKQTSTAGSINLPQDLTEDDAGYAQTYAEGIFSKEHHRTDNMGDINDDGVPDYYSTYDYKGGKLTTVDGQGSELVAVSEVNDDADFYPASSQLGKSTLIPGAISGWETKGQAFDAYREIRGYHEGLNFGMFRFNADERKYGWVSDLHLSDNEKRSLLKHAFDRRDAILENVRKKVGGIVWENYTWGDYEEDDWAAITNMLATVVRAGTSHKTGFRPAYYDTTDWVTNLNVSIVAVPETNKVAGVEVVTTNDCWQYVYTNTGLNPATNIVKMVVTTFTNKVTNAEVTVTNNPCDYITFNDINVGDWLSIVASTPTLTVRPEQVAAKAYIDRTWHRFISEGHWGWTCENRTDPTVEDTDGDEIPDGYEYFLWYDAVVGTEGTNRLTGCRFDLSDIESRENEITPEDIAEIYNPNKAGTNWKSLDTDKDGISDYEEFLIGTSPVDWDTDRDGMSDLYEVMYNINPLSDGVGANGAMNADGDYMAVITADAAKKLYALTSATNVIYTMYAGLAQLANYTYVQATTNGTLWMLDADYVTSALAADPETNCVTVIAKGFQVAKFNNGYILPTERTAGFAPRLFVTLNLDPQVECVADATVSLYHNQVYNYFGFDPRTAWYKDPNGDCSARFGGAAGRAINTSAFTAKDEYLLLKFRYLTGIRSYADDVDKLDHNKTTIYSIVLSGTTNPNGSFENKKWGDSETVYRQSQHGADTDGDGVPDGWELYLGVNPNKDYRISYGATGYDERYYELVGVDGSGDEDGLGFAAEYAGTDTCGYYADCPTVYANYPAKEGSLIYGWINKYLPTDPVNADTDGDGLKDGAEGKNWTGDYTMNRWGQDNNRSKESTSIRGVNYYMIYGEPADGGTSCRKGGGYNPCSIDTDGDGLPDPWEHQYSGLLFLNDEIVTEENTGVEDFYVFNPENGMPTGAYDDIRAAASALGWDFSLYTNDVFHVIMGQDGTVSDASCDYGIKAHDRDWDADGLQNWQEYMVQAMRHFRYDDCKTPLMGRDIPVTNYKTGTIDDGAWNGDKGFPQISITSRPSSGELQTLEVLGYTNFVSFVRSNSDYLRKLGYFASPLRSWDPYAGYVYMLPPKTFYEFPRTDWYEFNVQQTNTTGHTVWGYHVGGAYKEWVDIASYPYSVCVTNSIVTNTSAGVTEVIGKYVGPAPVEPYTHDQILLWEDKDGANYYVAVDTNSTKMVGGVMTGYKFWTVSRLQTGVATNTVSLIASNIYYSASAYVGTDPRLWDTDEDGMDDYYELFHGLNPILGDIGLSAESSETKDVIAKAYGYFVSAWRNAWVGWGNTTRPTYDAVKYPWMVGEGLCDADGDGLRNEEESITANMTPPMTYHTDPTPLWMTDSTVASTDYVGVVTTVLSNDTGRVEGTPWAPIPIIEVVTNAVYGDAVKLFESPSFTSLFYANDGVAVPFGIGSYFYSFEENEGYDTDNDWRSDSVEMRQTAEPTSDPLDSGDVVRRQSIWFGGASKPGVAISYEPSRRNTYGYDFFKQFTVEAWIMPTTPNTGVDQYVVSRASKYPPDAEHPTEVIRMNFALGIDGNGAFFGEFQESNTKEFRLTGGNPTAGEWTHVAATYDGATFTLYINGKSNGSQSTTLIPANGVRGPIQDPQFTGAFPYEKETYSIVPSITILGARADGDGAFDVNVAGSATGWTGIATNFFAGSVAEVRFWDGARSAAAIKQNYNVRFDAQTVKDLRQAVYNQYNSGKRRNAGTLDPELVQHYGFGSLPGATDEKYVQRVPAGFETNVLARVRNPATGIAVNEATLNVGWWAPIATNAAFKSVYSSPHVVPWIENTVAHLPRLCGTLADSVYWSENFAGYTPAKFHKINGEQLEKYDITNSMNPYSLVRLGNEEKYAYQKTYRLAQSAYAGGGATAADNQAIRNKYLYDFRMSFDGTSDLVPLGSAFAMRQKKCWDGMGAESAWAATADRTAGILDGDLDDDGVADKWAVANTGKTDLDYLRELSKGWLPDGTTDSAYANKEDVDGDGMPDWWEKYYGVFAYDGDDDTDRDGLSNYQEYLIGEVYRDMWPAASTFALLKPNSAHSVTGKSVTDYFLKFGSVYYGELFADHDQIEDWWEDQKPSVRVFGGTSMADYSRYVYDANRDVLGNGWDNWSLARAWFHESYTSNVVSSTVNPNSGETVVTTNVALFSKVDDNGGVPTPKILARITYNGARGNLGGGTTKYQLILKAWSMENTNDPQVLGSPDMVWGRTIPSQSSLLLDGALEGFSSIGAIRPGKNMFVAYVAEGEFALGAAAPAYVPGMPYGVATDVDVGPIGSSYIRIEMTDFNPSMPRINIADALVIQDEFASLIGPSDEEKKSCFEKMAEQCTDRGVWAKDQLAAAYKVGTDTHGASSNAVKSVKVTILRSGVNDEYKDEKDNPLSSTNKLIERTFALDVHNVLTEADFLSEATMPDLDWGGARQAYDDADLQWDDITNAYYRIVLFDGTTAEEVQNNNLCTMFVNKFEKGDSQTPVANMGLDTYSGQPTFVWTHTNTIDKVYPAFQLRVWTSNTAGDCIFDSGVLRAPARDPLGRYKWTAPLWTDSMTASNVVFKAGETYYWSVSMLDAKFITPDDINEVRCAFRMEKTSPGGEANDYGMIPLMVKYMGPGSVATNAYKGCLRIEAFSTPDFKGVPYGAAYISDLTNLTNENAVVENAVITGLPASQKYYVRAYIDSDGDGDLDPWESWGYVCHLGDSEYDNFYSPRAIAPGNAVPPANCVIYVEDADTNCNMIPDIWEYEKNGLDDTKSLTPYIAFSSSGDYTSHTNAIATVVGGKAGAKATLKKKSVSFGKLAYASALESASSGTLTASELMLLGVTIDTTDSTHIKIASFSLEEGISLAVDIDDSVEAVAASGLALTHGEIDVTVEYATTLANGGDWQSVGSTIKISFPLKSGTFVIPAKDIEGANKAMAKVSNDCGGSCYFRIKAVTTEN